MNKSFAIFRVFVVRVFHPYLSERVWSSILAGMKLLCLTTFPVEAAATRYRCVQFFSYLADDGFECRLRPFLSPELFGKFYSKGRVVAKAAQLGLATLSRLADIARPECDLVLVKREAALFGPPAIEWFLARILKKPPAGRLRCAFQPKCDHNPYCGRCRPVPCREKTSVRRLTDPWLDRKPHDYAVFEANYPGHPRLEPTASLCLQSRGRQRAHSDRRSCRAK